MLAAVWRPLFATLGLWAAGAAALRALVVPAEVCPPVDPTSAVASARASADWIVRAERPDGSYVYEYDRDAGAEVPGYNVVRHAGVTMSLYLFVASGETAYLAPADRATAWMQDHLYRHSDWAALEDPTDGSVEAGASALMLAALAQRRIATNDGQYDALMHQLARYLVAMQQDDGSFLLAWSKPDGRPDPAQRSKYATGEAMWALALMHRLFPGEGWDAAVRMVADYLSLHRDAYEQMKFPPWADQWAAYGLAEMAAWAPATLPGGAPALDDANVTYARSLAERFGFLVRNEAQRRDSWLSNAIHGRRSRSAGMGTWVEGLGSLRRLSASDPRLADMRPKLDERLACGAGMLRDRQVTREQAAKGRQPALEEGAWFTNGHTRMDDQQHALAALLRSTVAFGAAP